MNSSLHYFKKVVCIAVLSSSFFAVSVYASGSFGGGVNGGNDSIERQQYHQGKLILKKKLKCSDCLLDGEKINSKTAPDVLAKLTNGDFSDILNSGEEQALATYLERRYRISGSES